MLASEVEKRLRLRLVGDTSPGKPAVAWADARGTIVLHLSTLNVVLKDGWLQCSFDANPADEPHPATLQFLYHLGRDSDSDGLTAASTINAPGAPELAAAWGDVLQRVIWDGVLDVIEGVVNVAAHQNTNRALTLLGFLVSEGTLHVDVQIADAA